VKVLYITNKPIYPNIDGGCVAMVNFLQCLLHKDISTKHLLIHTQKHPFVLGNYPDELVQKVKPEAVFINTTVTPKRAIGNILKKGSYNVNRFHSDEMEKLISAELKADNYTTVILESLFVTPYLPIIRKNFSGKVFVRTHNVESNIWGGLADSTKDFARKRYLRKLAKDLRTYEVNTLNTVDGILALSNMDIEAFKAQGVETASTLIPVAIELNNETANTEINHFFHLGVMNWQPNIQAAQRLVKIFPAIRQQVPDAKLRIAGKYAKEVITENIEDGIIVDGFVDDAKAYSREAGILVSPILSGSGIRIKLLEAMALGIPSVTTTLGAQGIHYMNSKCLIVRDSDDEITQACIELARDKNLREEISKNARDYIRKNHNIDSISSEIVEFIEHT